MLMQVQYLQVTGVAQRIAADLQERESQCAGPACTARHAVQQTCYSLAHRVSS